MTATGMDRIRSASILLETILRRPIPVDAAKVSHPHPLSSENRLQVAQAATIMGMMSVPKLTPIAIMTAANGAITM